MNAISNAKQEMTAKIDPYYVSMEFVREYYKIMHDDPSRLHCFYNQVSTVSHGVEGDAIGNANISQGQKVTINE
jgi:hypothetical protein